VRDDSACSYVMLLRMRDPVRVGVSDRIQFIVQDPEFFTMSIIKSLFVFISENKYIFFIKVLMLDIII